jgi:NAD(P)-dependent dehydrogenase (short-subunit alcohol dehydrogenase family)
MLTGKTLVLTGAAGRLGQRMVRGLHAHGATVAGLVLNTQEAGVLSALDGMAGHVFIANTSQEAEVVACFAALAERYGRLDALIHTVGGWDGRPLLETSLADWQRQIEINLTTAFLCFREAARHMQGRGGRLIALASGQGADKGRAQQGAYSAAKAGVVRLVEAAAEEFVGTGLTAHALAPSMILYDGMTGPGVPADHLVELAALLCTDAGAALNGATLRAYGG